MTLILTRCLFIRASSAFKYFFRLQPGPLNSGRCNKDCLVRGGGLLCHLFPAVSAQFNGFLKKNSASFSVNHKFVTIKKENDKNCKVPY